MQETHLTIAFLIEFFNYSDRGSTNRIVPCNACGKFFHRKQKLKLKIDQTHETVLILVAGSYNPMSMLSQYPQG